jgi:FkbH-like protein
MRTPFESALFESGDNASHAPSDPMLAIPYIKVLSEGGKIDQAVQLLRHTLASPLSYTFFTRAERLIKSLAKQDRFRLRTCKIAVLGTSTTSFLMPVLQAYCFRDRIGVETYEGLYGALEQEILDPQSGLARFQPDLVFIVNHWRDLNLSAITPDDEKSVSNIVSERKNLWTALSNRFGCHVVQFAFDLPSEDAYGYLSRSLPGGRARMVERINAELIQQAPAHVSIFDTLAIQRARGASGWHDPVLWTNFRQHPGNEAIPAVADAMLAHVRAVFGLARKVLITDLDNTLWKGIIGEDGLQGIKVGPGSPEGEAHQALQKYLLELKSLGVLLAVCSKNNHEDALLPFQKHEGMLLKLDDFAAFEANWNDKATNLRDIARKLSLGIDSFVFLDDNPVERAWVRSQLPEVAVVELGPKVFSYVHDLDRCRHFYTLRLSAEDQARAEQYRSEATREKLRQSSQSFEEFLQHLQLRASVSEVNADNLARVTQLTNKTNQFNVTTRRYTEAQIEALAVNRNAWTGAFRLADRMGDYGLIGVIFSVPGSSAFQWEIDTWLMSCRVLGRQLENFMFDRLIEAAQEAGVREIIGVYRPTSKNGLVTGLFDQLGFEKLSATEQETRYRITVPSEVICTTVHVRNDSLAEVRSG